MSIDWWEDNGLLFGNKKYWNILQHEWTYKMIVTKDYISYDSISMKGPEEANLSVEIMSNSQL